VTTKNTKSLDIIKAILLWGSFKNYLETFQRIQASPPMIATLCTLVPPKNFGELMLNKSFIVYFFKSLMIIRVTRPILATL